MNNRNRRIDRNKTLIPEKGHRFLKVLLCSVLFVFLAIGSYRLVRGIQYWQRTKEIKRGYVQAVDALKLEQEKLKEEVYKLQHNLLTQERLARELGYIRPGETVYKIVPKSK